MLSSNQTYISITEVRKSAYCPWAPSHCGFWHVWCSAFDEKILSTGVGKTKKLVKIHLQEKEPLNGFFRM